MKITEKKFNVITGEESITERDETPQEIAEREAFEAEAEQLKAVAATKAAAREAVYLKLGLTSDDVEALFK
jgi:hypothetical protein